MSYTNSSKVSLKSNLLSVEKKIQSKTHILYSTIYDILKESYIQKNICGCKWLGMEEAVDIK